jgi:hypothetical protein
MTRFVVVVSSANLDSRIAGLGRILGFPTGGSSSSDLRQKDFRDGSAAYSPKGLKEQRTELTITYSFPPRSSPKDFIASLRSLFPEMEFKCDFLEKFRIGASSYKYVRCRGFLSVSRQGVFPQDVVFLLSNSPLDDEVVIAQDSLDSNRKQFVFVKSWETSSNDFIQNVLEPWMVAERIRVIEECDEIGVPMFSGPSAQVLSESRMNWPGIPTPSILFSKDWLNRSQEYPNKNWVITSSKRNYADLDHAFVVLMEKSKEYVRYNCSFCIPDARGRIIDMHIEPAQTGYDLVVSCEVAASGVRIKASCALGSGTPIVFESDADAVNKFNTDFLPTFAKAELLAPDLVDRDTYHAPQAGSVATVTQTVPHVSVTTQIGLPVRNDVLVGAQTMVGAYARFFIMENTLRTVVKEKLLATFGPQWASQLARVLIARKDPVEQARMNHALATNPDQILQEVYYRDLNNIVDQFWSILQPVFQDKDRTLLKLRELEDLRNDIAHNRVLADHDIKRIEVYYMDLLSRI